jgi:type IV pilus assembly protein PilW
MNGHSPGHIARSNPGGSGYTLIELLIALLIALFLIAGLVAMLQGTSRTSVNELGLAQLQNDERIAVSVLTDVIQQAGYYPITQAGSLQSAFPVAPPLPAAPAFTQPGQIIAGETNATANGDSITVRYQTDATGTVLNCLGQSHDSPSQAHEYTFSVNASRQLTCAVDGNLPVALTGNVQSLQILYGIDATATATYSGAPANAYVLASQMTPTSWTNVSSVKITITFVNPLAGQPAQDRAPAISFSRVVGIMARTGVNVITDI